MKRQSKPWMRPLNKVAAPTYDDLVRALGDLISDCHRWRMYGHALNTAEHIHNRARVAKLPRRATLPSGQQGRLI